MAAIFQKPFSVFYNAIRGVDRFISLQNLLELQNREIKKTYTKEDVFNNENISFDIDYSKTNENISKATKFAFEWLGSVLKMPVNKFVKFYKENSMLHIEEKKKMIEKKPPVKLSADGERCRIVVALMKKFGIKHIVISAGTRNITFNRLFEANQDFFKTYHVTDERSAGFFALGLATKLKEIVCICCTSGPSVCNYVPPVTEAFYQRVPLLILTTDRYPGMFECQDHQSVDQIKMLSAIVKKSFSLPAGNEIKPRITATTVSEALYEIENKWSGPVHLNVHIKPIDKLAVISNYLTLPDIKLRNRITPKNENLLSECVEYLKKKKKILVIINQQMPPNNKLKQLFIDFASKYNCVLYVDHFSNLRNNYTVFHGEEQLKDAALSPDLVINFGEERTNISPGLNLLNCSEYWRVNGDGKFTNKYFILSNVFECSDEFFLQYFSENAKENTNDKIYLNLLKENKKELFKYDFDKWEMKYTIGSLIKNMPENSLFHIARSLTVRHAHKFDKLPNGVEVYCNSGVNGIDGCASTFMGQAAVACDDELAFLCIGDLTFFYDINSLWNKDLKGNIRIMLNNNGGAGLLTYSKSDGAIHSHNAIAKGWVESLGFKYITANNKEEFDKLLPIFVAKESDKPIFFEIFTTRS
jgi:2-succinyl-5-enolpyruvyl-6-hydroxy-3-cyclohexene-1-carboxylate synthase